MDIIDEAIELESDRAMLHTLRAQINYIGENQEEAIADASRAIKLDRKSLVALLIRANVNSDMGGEERLDSALEDIEEVLELVPYNVEAIQLRGIVYSQQLDFKNAIKDFKTLAESDPTNAFYRNQLAVLYNADDQPSRAVQIYRKLLDEYSLDNTGSMDADGKILLLRRRFAALRGVADARLSIGEHKKAVENYDEALEIEEQLQELLEEEAGPDDEPQKLDDGVLNNLAWVLATSTLDEVRDGERAIELATKAAEITDYKEAHVLSTLASGYAETGDFDEAIKWIEKAIEVNQENGKNGTVPEERTKEQRASLQKEFDSYKKKEAWRELQDVEKEKADKRKAARKAAKEKKAKQDSKNEDDSDDDSEDDKDKDDEDKDDEDKDDEDKDDK